MTLRTDEEVRTGAPGGDMPFDRHLGPEDPAPEVLFREARLRRRRRWMVGAVVAALVIATVAVVANRGGPRVSATATLRSHGKVGGPTGGTRPKGAEVAASAHYTSIYGIGVAGSGEEWALNGVGVYVTANSGRTWRTITPPLIKLGDPVEDFDSLVAVGSEDLWMPVNDVFGVVPPGEAQGGFDRAQGIEYSTNGGRTWTFTTLVPGCFVSCGPNSVSFIDSRDGFAAGETTNNGPTTLLYSTVDGGVTWQPVATIPGGGAHDIAFTDNRDGWAVTGATYGTSAQNGGRMTDPGGTLYRTTDAGATWSRATGLPTTSRYQLPVFFNHGQGVVLGQEQGERTKIPIVYATDDDGASWSAHSLPNNKTVATYAANNPVADSQFAFSALSSSQWEMYIGPYLYVTNNAGRTWDRTAPTPKLAPGAVSLASFSSPRYGMAKARPPGCLANDECPAVLIRTTDGGRHWTAVAP